MPQPLSGESYMPVLMIDLFNVPVADLEEGNLLRTVSDLATLALMEIRSGPHGYHSQVPTDQQPLLCFEAIAIISTSHISVLAQHLAGEDYGEAHVTIFSCNSIPLARVVDFCMERFHTGLHHRDVDVHTVKRATRSPRLSENPSGETGWSESENDEDDQEQGVLLPTLPETVSP